MDDEPPRDHAVIEQPCDRCGALAAIVISQSVVGGTLTWNASTRCRICGNAEEACGWHDDMPDDLRATLISQIGLTKALVDPEVARPLRKPLLAVFRQRGTALDEAVAMYTVLTTTGIAGTPAETELLAAELTSAGAIVSLIPHRDGG